MQRESLIEPLSRFRGLCGDRDMTVTDAIDVLRRRQLLETDGGFGGRRVLMHLRERNNAEEESRRQCFHFWSV